MTIAAGSTGDRTYTATWKAIDYDITYDLAGGTVATDNPAAYTIESEITLTNPTRTGYNFGGWTGTDLAEATETVNIAAGSTGARAYTATWTLHTYNITYDLGGGSVDSDNPATYTIESDAITLTNPTHTGYTFAGWTGTDLAEATETVTIAAGSTGDRTYTATWKAIYTITIGSNIENGTVTADRTEAAEGELVTLTVVPAEGYELESLMINDEDQTSYVIDGENTLIFGMPNFNLFVTATFTEIPAATYTIYYGDWENGIMTADKTEVTEGETVTLTVTPNEGYGLERLYYIDFSSYDEVDITADENGNYTFTMPATEVMLFASFKEIPKFTVTINADDGCNVMVMVSETDVEYGGTPVESGDTVPYGTVLQVNAAAKTGYQLTATPETTYTVTGDLTIAAASQKRTYTLTLNHENGTEPTASVDDLIAVPHGTKVTVTAGAANDGYEFIGWYQTNGKLLTSNTSYAVTVYTSLTIEARYQATAGVVTFMANGNVQKTVTTSSITADDFPAQPSALAGFEFDSWDKTVEEINTTLAKGGNVTVTAKFKAAAVNVTISIYNGESETPTVQEYSENKWIFVTADEVSGKAFVYWKLDDEILSYNRTATFRTSSSSTLTAVYAAEALDAVGTAVIRTGTYNADTKKLSFVAYLTVPDGASITAAGLVAASGTSTKYTAGTELTSANADYTKASAKAVGTAGPVTYTWTKGSVAIGDTWYVRPYVSYTYNGETETVYGDLVTVQAGGDYDSNEKAMATIRSANYNTSTKKASFVAYLTVPDGGTIVKAGLVAAPGTSFNASTTILTWDTSTYQKVSAKATGTAGPVTYTWTKSSVSAGDVWYIRPYVIYTDTGGTQHTLYGALVTFTAGT